MREHHIKVLYIPSTAEEHHTNSFRRIMSRVMGYTLPSILPLLLLYTGLAIVPNVVLATTRLFPEVSPIAGFLLDRFPLSDEARHCVQGSRLMESALKNRTLWAVRMLDASESGVTGALWGARYALGNFDACLSAGKASPVGSRYCLATLSVQGSYDADPLPAWDEVAHVDSFQDALAVVRGSGLRETAVPLSDVHVAVCVPSACRPALLESALREYLRQKPSVLGVTPAVRVLPEQCVSADEQSNSPGQVWFWFILVSLVMLVVLASVLDRLPFEHGSRFRLVISAWDWRRHVTVLSRQDSPLAGMNLNALSGLRCVNTITFMIAHKAFNTPRTATSNDFTVTSSFLNPLLTLGTHASLLVDTCFYLAGFFMVLSSSSSNPAKSVAQRFLRLTPPYAFIILFYATVLNGVYNGPLWKTIIFRETDACRRWWWTNLLYINNYVYDKMDNFGCMLQSWSLAVDMHQFAAGSFLLWACVRWPRSAKLIFGSCVVLSVLPLFFSTLLNRRPALMTWSTKVLFNPFDYPMWYEVYVPTHMRSAPYVVGMIGGGMAVLLQRRDFRLGQVASHALTWCSIVFLMLLSMSSTIMSDPDRAYNALEAALYASLSPVAWAICLGGLVIALIFGAPTWFHSLLCWQPLVTLGRLSYGVYLVHFAVQLGIGASLRNLTEVDLLFYIKDSLSDLVIAYFLSFVLYLLVEAPTREVSKIIFAHKVLKTNSEHTAYTEKSATINNNTALTNNNIDNRKVAEEDSGFDDVSFEISKAKVKIRRRINGDSDRSFLEEFLRSNYK